MRKFPKVPSGKFVIDLFSDIYYHAHRSCLYRCDLYHDFHMNIEAETGNESWCYWKSLIFGSSSNNGSKKSSVGFFFF